MRLLDFVSAALSGLQQRTAPKTSARLRQNRASPFRIEQLEPRILLSGEVAPQEAAITLIQNQSTLSEPAIVEQLATESKVTVSLDQWNETIPDTRTPTPNTITSETLEPLVNQAVKQLSQFGFSAEGLKRAQDAKIEVVDLPGWT